MDVDENRDFQLVFARPDVDADTILEWPTDHHVIGFFYETDRPHVEYIDPLAGGIAGLMEKSVPGAFHQVIDASRDGKMVVIECYSDVLPLTYYLLDLNKHALTAIGQQSAALAQAQLAPDESHNGPRPRWPQHPRLPHTAGRVPSPASVCPPSSIRTAAPTRATSGATIRWCRSWPAAATRCCS